MIRRVIMLAAVSSLMLAIAFAALWARSYWVMDSVYLERLGAGWQFTSVQGRLIAVKMPAQWSTRDVHRGAYAIEAGRVISSSEALADSGDTTTFGPVYWGRDGAMTAGLVRRMGGTPFPSSPGRSWLGVPHAALLVPFAAIGLFALAPLLRRRRRIARGMCPACGYDLRASTGRCPECGATIPPPPTG